LIFTQVVFRYILNNSLIWTEELAKYLFVWLTFIGAASVFKDKKHIGVDYFVGLLPCSVQKYAHLFDVVLITLFSVVATVIGYCWTVDIWGTLSPALELPIAVILYAAFPTSSLLIAILGVRQLMKKNQSQETTKEGAL